MKMKFTFLAGMFFTACLGLNAQIYSDNFDNAVNVPSSWAPYNFTGSPNASLAINNQSLEVTVDANVALWYQNVVGCAFPATTGDVLNVSFDMKASAGININAQLNTKANKGLTHIIDEPLALTSTSQHFSFTSAACTSTEDYLLWFTLNGVAAGTVINIDNVIITKGSTSVNDELLSGELTFYQNQATDDLIINGGKDGEQVSIYSLTGQKVLVATINGDAISLGNLGAGTYVVKMGETVKKLQVVK